VGTRPNFSPQSFSDLDEHVRQFIARVKSSPLVPNKDNVRGLVYAVETGCPREVLG
jgi:carbonic anhydrase